MDQASQGSMETKEKQNNVANKEKLTCLHKRSQINSFIVRLKDPLKQKVPLKVGVLPKILKTELEYYREVVTKLHAKIYITMNKLLGDGLLLGDQELSLLEGSLSQVVSLCCGVDFPGPCAGCHRISCTTPATCMYNLLTLMLDLYGKLCDVTMSDRDKTKIVDCTVKSLMEILAEVEQISATIPYT